MGFGDVFKSSFLENITSVSILDMVIALVLAFGIGMFIFFVYKKTYSGVMYAPGFGVTLVALTMITTVVILAVTSNVVLSLGMVGALSIVRFRTAIKEPLDIAFLHSAANGPLVHIGVGGVDHGIAHLQRLIDRVLRVLGLQKEGADAGQRGFRSVVQRDVFHGVYLRFCFLDDSILKFTENVQYQFCNVLYSE